MPRGRTPPRQVNCLNCSDIFTSIKPAEKHCSEICRKEMSYKLKQEKRDYNKYDRNYAMKYYYGISEEIYQKMLKASNGVCNICKESPKNKRLFVDHCHDSGKIRGLLCITCNSGLGMFKDNIDLLDTAKAYLQQGIK